MEKSRLVEDVMRVLPQRGQDALCVHFVLSNGSCHVLSVLQFAARFVLFCQQYNCVLCCDVHWYSVSSDV